MPATESARLSRPWLYAVAIMLSASVLSVFMLTRDNGWGDDFAGYILQARSIVTGNMGELVAENVLAVERSSGDLAPGNYPWGFPLMLAPVYALAGVKVLGFKLVITLCHALLILTAFLLARTRLDDLDALLLAALIAFNTVLIAEGQGEILSDIPFTLFSTTALWLILLSPSVPTPREAVARGVVTGLAIFMAAFVRPNGFLLLVPLAAAFVQQRRNQAAGAGRAGLNVLAACVVLALLWALQALVFPSVAQRNVSFSLSPASLWSMLLYYLPLPAYFFRHLGPAAWILYGLQIILSAVSTLVHWKRDLPLHAYVLATISLYAAFPYQQGARYLYPLWPVLLFFTLDGARVAADKLRAVRGWRLQFFLRAVWGVVAVLSLAICARLAWLNMANNRSEPGRTAGAFSPGSSAMFDFISDHTPADSVIIFYKPRAMRLRTERDSFLTTDCRDLPKADFVVTVESNGTYDQIAPESVRHCNPTVMLTPLYTEDLFSVYQIQPAQ